MKTRLSKNHEYATIIVSHSELTDIWVALLEYRDNLKKDGFPNYARLVDNACQQLCDLAGKM